MADKHVLVVEGQDDLHVFVHLAQHYDIPLKPQDSIDDASDGIKLKDGKGINRIIEREYISTTLKDEGLERLGIVVDADTSIENRWKSLRDRLVEYGYSDQRIPKAPHKNGTIIEDGDKPIVGVWLMPDNKLAGEAVGLEHFIAFLVPEDDTLWNRAEQCLNSIPEAERHFGIHKQKAHVHTWLAWQKEPGKPMGQAITAKYLDANAQYAQHFVKWLRRLFGIS